MADHRTELIERLEDAAAGRNAEAVADYLAAVSAATRERDPAPADGELILQVTTSGGAIARARWSEALDGLELSIESP